MRNMIFRGYDVVEHSDGRCAVGRDGKVLCEQPTIAAAHAWINDRRRQELAARRQEEGHGQG